MGIDTQKTVAEIALEKPHAAAVFEKFGIDYCCGGRKPLAEACQAAGLDVNQVAGLLETPAGADSSAGQDHDWSDQPLAALISHIVGKHHGYVRQESLRLRPLMAKVVSKHGERHPELGRIEQLFASLLEELSLHMMKEEKMLFPYIVDLEQAVTGNSAPPQAPFGTVQNPVRMMVMEHDNAGNLLREIRGQAHGFAAPEDACTSFKVLYQGLQAFEADLHQHIHLENNLLFPRAIALEEATQAA